jgi:hypothetical protein
MSTKLEQGVSGTIEAKVNFPTFLLSAAVQITYTLYGMMSEPYRGQKGPADTRCTDLLCFELKEKDLQSFLSHDPEKEMNSLHVQSGYILTHVT